MTIHKNRYYILETIPGLSGFQRWNERERRIVTGHKAANNRYDVVGEWKPPTCGVYAIEDGHLPGHQPIGGYAEVVDFLTRNPYGSALVVQL